MVWKQLSWLPLAGLTLALVACGANAAENQLSKKDGRSSAAGVAELLHVAGKLPMPSLSGLVKPEKVGLLTDNQCRIKDNEANLLSGNEADVDVLSGNETAIFSGIRILSGISVEVHITIHSGGDKAPAAKAKKAGGKRKSHKSRKHKAHPKSKAS